MYNKAAKREHSLHVQGSYHISKSFQMIAHMPEKKNYFFDDVDLTTPLKNPNILFSEIDSEIICRHRSFRCVPNFILIALFYLRDR